MSKAKAQRSLRRFIQSGFERPVAKSTLGGFFFVQRPINMKHSPLLLFPILFLTACATANGPQYMPVKAGKGEAKIVVYRSSYPYAVPVQVNGKLACEVPSNGFFIVTAKPNTPLTLTYSPKMDWRDSIYTITPRAGETHYVRIEHNNAVLSAGFGLLWNAAIQNEADFIFREGNASEAVQTKEACQP